MTESAVAAESNPQKRVGKPAILAAYIGPLLGALGWIIAGASWPGYDPVVHTISDLAANDSPVQAFMSSSFILGAIFTMLVAVYSRPFAMPGRVVLAIASIATVGLTVFTTPSQVGHSVPHRIFAIISFVAMSGWPLFAWSRDARNPWVLRPLGGILATVGLAVISIAFLLVWTNPDFHYSGIAERILVVTQAVYLSYVVLAARRAFNG